MFLYTFHKSSGNSAFIDLKIIADKKHYHMYALQGESDR